MTAIGLLMSRASGQLAPTSELLAQLPSAYREGFCHLCHIPINEMNECFPCMHWCVNAYFKPRRLEAVIRGFGVVALMEYLMAIAVTERQSGSRAAIVTANDPQRRQLEVTVGNRQWRLGFDHVAAEYELVCSNRKTGSSFSMEVSLDQAAIDRLEARALAYAQLARGRRKAGLKRTATATPYPRLGLVEETV
jgi:hypothetical protein